VWLVSVTVDGSIAAYLVTTETTLGLLHRGVLCLAWSFQQARHEIQRASLVIAREGVINICNL
jgi:hypothetical protein